MRETRDVPEFADLKKVGLVLDGVTGTRPRPPLSKTEFRRLARESGLDDDQAHVLRMHLRQQRIEIRD
jgi:hypothetical protein